jgi:Fe-S cluster assembly protein SufD
MNSEQQYIDLFQENRKTIDGHSTAPLNAVRDKAFKAFCKQGFPSRKVERYKYTDMQKLFAPDYGLNLTRFEIPVNPYDVFKCEVQNLSTSLYFVVNDGFYTKTLPQAHLPGRGDC